MNFYILRSSLRFSPGDLCMNQAIREFLDLAARIQITLFPESLTLQGIQAFSGEELSLLLLHTGLPLLLLSQDIQLDLGGPRS
ncbi:Phosphoserine phosphatase SerB [Phytophthora palmivora]|uniref:Phosphoserine phosphatase SerB n=1 Tax=Phytophthora palmivora TaxID=4796 RepID=A0A2P4XHA7_9STRA|nr:Phosphoserine phosphatase SerB [Phytophthora palmivora]